MTTLFLVLVVAGYAIFMLALGVVWARGYAADLRAARTPDR